LARSADRLRAGAAAAAGEGAPQSGLVTGSATALEKERREPRNIRAAMEGKKGREGRVWGMDIAACCSMDHCEKTGDQNRGPAAKLAPGLRCPPPSQGMRSDRKPETGYPIPVRSPLPRSPCLPVV